jgi:hypothetical protein
MNDGISTAEALMLGNKGDCSGFGGGNGIWAILIFAMLFGGRGGLFGNQGYGNQGGCANLSNQITNDFLFSNLNQSIHAGFGGVESGLKQIQSELCAGFYNQNTTALNGFNGVDKALCTGFASVNHNLTDLGFRMQQSCCETNRNIDSVRYENARNTCEIITSANNNTQKIIDWLTQEKICSLNSELQTAQGTLSNCHQTQTILNSLGKYVPFSSCPCT